MWVLANDRRGVALQYVTAERNGKRLDVRSCNVFELGADGKVTEVWAMSSDTAATSDFFS